MTWKSRLGRRGLSKLIIVFSYCNFFFQYKLKRFDFWILKKGKKGNSTERLFFFFILQPIDSYYIFLFFFQPLAVGAAAGVVLFPFPSPPLPLPLPPLKIPLSPLFELFPLPPPPPPLRPTPGASSPLRTPSEELSAVPSSLLRFLALAPLREPREAVRFGVPLVGPGAGEEGGGVTISVAVATPLFAFCCCCWGFAPAGVLGLDPDPCLE